MKNSEMDNNNSNEAEILNLVSRVLQGDQESFQGIVDSYKSLVFKLARSFLGNYEEALDASQEIFIRIYKGLSSYKLDKRFEPWLYAISLNYLRSRYRQIKRNTRHRNAIMDELRSKEEARQNSPEDDYFSGQIIRETVEKLPEELKTVIGLYYIEGKNVDEICAALSLGRENVKSKLHRARKQIRKIIEKQMQPGKENDSI